MRDRGRGFPNKPNVDSLPKASAAAVPRRPTAGGSATASLSNCKVAIAVTLRNLPRVAFVTCAANLSHMSAETALGTLASGRTCFAEELAVADRTAFVQRAHGDVRRHAAKATALFGTKMTDLSVF